VSTAIAKEFGHGDALLRSDGTVPAEFRALDRKSELAIEQVIVAGGVGGENRPENPKQRQCQCDHEHFPSHTILLLMSCEIFLRPNPCLAPNAPSLSVRALWQSVHTFSFPDPGEQWTAPNQFLIC
jgi:hypothetical protein